MRRCIGTRIVARIYVRASAIVYTRYAIYMSNAQYKIDADMLGNEFRGSLSDLHDFIIILAEETNRPVTDFVLQQHVGNDPEAQEPSDDDWWRAVEAFRNQHPELWEVVE